jgi:protein SHQ1
LLQEIGVGVKDEGLIKEVDAELSKSEVTSASKPLIQVIDDSDAKKTDLEETAIEGDTFNWEIKQGNEEEPSLLKVKYGFNNLYDSIIAVSISNGNDINELDDPEHTKPDDRIKERLLKENYKFDPEYYAADYMTSKYADEDDYSQVRDLLKWENPLISTNDISFTEEENNKMLDLPKKVYFVTNPKPLYYTILSLLFSICFEMRETEGELNTESAWSIGKLTPQLCCLDQKIMYDDVQSVSMIKAIIITSIRRALSYPLHRNFELSFKAWLDVAHILKRGKKLVLKMLLSLHESFRFHDVYYVYNKIVIDDLINWLITDSRDNDFVLKSLGEEVTKDLMALEKHEIVFEQLDEEGDVDTSINILEIEQLAEEMYKQADQ